LGALGTLSVLEGKLAVVALQSLAETEISVRQGFATLRTGHVFSPGLARTTTNSVADVKSIHVKVRVFAKGANSIDQDLPTALTFELVVALKKHFFRRQSEFSSTRTGNKLFGFVAACAGDWAAHCIILAISEKKTHAGGLRTAEVVHLGAAAAALDELPEVRFIEEDCLLGLIAVGADLERPELVAALVVAGVAVEHFSGQV